ncbi:energy transducer TonB [Calothrix sp. UHCC 0171]|uniref:energy transducer TonB n=1 Tax=Calothrix sp. UHCC 0171 TaxID=3110245 RepID=UPI002B1F426F|nr:energy transducer TonB [Calothrix sp. UHCC 0171]MEA5574464.1 energy transducer TonB [Calothrix sp. UHCC 0171]
MSFSSILVRWREKEAEKFRRFIAYSSLGSVALHIGLLAFSISNVLKNQVPADISSKPIEVMIIEPPLPNLKQTPEFKVGKSQRDKKSGGGGKISMSLLEKSNHLLSNNLTNYKSDNSSPSIIQQPIPLQIQRIKPKLNIPSTFRQTQRQVENKVGNTLESFKQEIDTKIVAPSVIPQPAPKTDILTTLEQTIKPSVNPVKNASLTPTTISTTQEDTTSTGDNLTKPSMNFSSGRLRKIIADGRNGITGTNDTFNSGNNGNGSIGNSLTVNGSATGFGKGNGTDVAARNHGNPKPTEEKKVATAPIPKSPSSSKLNRADCQECNIKYPENARKRKIEGNPEVTIDYNDKGIVTNVRLNRSSGSQELDEALLEQARNFKLKPSEGGKQGVRVSANFAIQGSQNHREAIARKKKREEQRQQRELVSADNSTEETLKIKRLRRRVITDVPPEENSRNAQEILKRGANTNTSNQSIGETESTSGK